MDWNQASAALYEGKAIKLPEWGGYWFNKEGRIMVLTKAGDILDTPMVEEFKNRTDWLISDGSLGYDFAILSLINHKKVSRKGWNTSGLYLTAQFPDSHSKMTQPYLYLTIPPGVSTQIPAMIGDARSPWVPSQTDMFATDWHLVD